METQSQRCRRRPEKPVSGTAHFFKRLPLKKKRAGGFGQEHQEVFVRDDRPIGAEACSRALETDPAGIEARLKEELKKLGRKIVVLDDDPTRHEFFR